MKLFYTVIFASLTYAGHASSDTIPKSHYNWEKLSIELGAYATNIHSNIRLGNDTYGLGIDINLEDALGLNTASATWRTHILYRFSSNRKHAISTSYFEIKRKASRKIDGEIKIGRTTFTDSTNVSSKFKLGIMQFNYLYSFLMDDRLNFFGSIGFYMMPTELAFGQNGTYVEQTNFIAPLPALGLGVEFFLSPKVLLKHHTNFFYLQFDNYKGDMVDLSILLEYHPIKHLGIGIGYNSFNIDLEVVRSSFVGNSEFIGNVVYKHSGFIMYMKFLL